MQRGFQRWLCLRIIVRKKNGVLRAALKQGKKEGRRENKLEVANNLLNRGMDILVISEIVGISEEEIRNQNESYVYNSIGPKDEGIVTGVCDEEDCEGLTQSCCRYYDRTRCYAC